MAAVQNENAMPANVENAKSRHAIQRRGRHFRQNESATPYSAADAKSAAKVKKAEAHFGDLGDFRKSKTSDEQQNVAPPSKRARLWQAALNVDQSLIWGATTVGLKTQGLAARAVRGPCVASRRGLTASKNLAKAVLAKTKRGVLSAGHNACMATVRVKTSTSKACRRAASFCRNAGAATWRFVMRGACFHRKRKPAVNAAFAEAAGCSLRKRKPAVDAKLLATAGSSEKEVFFSAAGLALFGGRSGGPTSVAEAEHAVLAEAASCLFRKRKPAVDAKPLAIADVPESVHGSVAEAVTAVVAESAYLVAKPQEQTAAAVHRASVQNEPETEQADAVVARMKVQPDRSWIGQKAVEDDALEEAEEEDADSASLSPLMI